MTKRKKSSSWGKIPRIGGGKPIKVYVPSKSDDRKARGKRKRR